MLMRLYIYESCCTCMALHSMGFMPSLLQLGMTSMLRRPVAVNKASSWLHAGCESGATLCRHAADETENGNGHSIKRNDCVHGVLCDGTAYAAWLMSSVLD